MQLEIGKRYVRRDGSVTEKLEQTRYRFSPFFNFLDFTFSEGNRSYRADGTFSEFVGREHVWDIVAPYLESKKKPETSTVWVRFNSFGKRYAYLSSEDCRVGDKAVVKTPDGTLETLKVLEVEKPATRGTKYVERVIPQKKKEFRVEVGKRYKRRDGGITGEMGYVSFPEPYVFKDSNNNVGYTPRGEFNIYHKSPLDLVEEYVERVIPQKKKDSVAATLSERNNTHGDFGVQAVLTQELKDVMHCSKNWSSLTKPHKEALESIAIKIGRILTGDPDTLDSWLDIAGYAELGRRDAEKRHAKS